MAVCVPGSRDDPPAVDLVALLDERRVPRKADEVGEHVPRLDQVVRHLGRNAVPDEPVRDPLGPVVGAPHALALRVVQASLDDRRAGRRRGLGGAADVIRMHVRDEDANDITVELRENVLPRRLHQAEAGVDERPAVASPQEVAVDMPGPVGSGIVTRTMPGSTLYQLVGFPGVNSHAWKNASRSSPSRVRRWR